MSWYKELRDEAVRHTLLSSGELELTHTLYPYTYTIHYTDRHRPQTIWLHMPDGTAL